MFRKYNNEFIRTFNDPKYFSLLLEFLKYFFLQILFYYLWCKYSVYIVRS